MILKKHLKKLKKSKTLENLQLESTKSVEISEREMSSMVRSKIDFARSDSSSLDLESNDNDAIVEILRRKIFPYLPKHLKSVFEKCLDEKEAKEAKMQTDRPGIRDGSVQTEDSAEKLDREIQTAETEQTETHSQTEVDELQDRQVQTDVVATEEISTETEQNLLGKAKESVDSRYSQTDILENGEKESQTENERKNFDDAEIQTEINIENREGEQFPEKKLENLTKCLEEHANIFREYADYSAELRKHFSSSENLAGSFRNEEVQTEPIWLPNWNLSNPIPFGCGLTSFIPGRNLFSPMATLLTPLGIRLLPFSLTLTTAQ